MASITSRSTPPKLLRLAPGWGGVFRAHQGGTWYNPLDHSRVGGYFEQQSAGMYGCRSIEIHGPAGRTRVHERESSLPICRQRLDHLVAALASGICRTVFKMYSSYNICLSYFQFVGGARVSVLNMTSYSHCLALALLFYSVQLVWCWFAVVGGPSITIYSKDCTTSRQGQATEAFSGRFPIQSTSQPTTNKQEQNKRVVVYLPCQGLAPIPLAALATPTLRLLPSAALATTMPRLLPLGSVLPLRLL